MRILGASDINQVPNNNVVLTFRVISVAFKGNTVAMNLSTAINTRLRIDTIWDTILKYDPTLHATVAKGPWS
jgi:hypothetical protein